jgi:hypothetical protein
VKSCSESLGSSCAPREVDCVSESEKQDPLDGPHDPKISLEKKDSSNSKSSASDTDTKRAKQYVLCYPSSLFNTSCLL